MLDDLLSVKDKAVYTPGVVGNHVRCSQLLAVIDRHDKQSSASPPGITTPREHNHDIARHRITQFSFFHEALSSSTVVT